MPKPKPTAAAKIAADLTAEQAVILFCAEVGIDHAAVGILPHAMQVMEIRGLIAQQGGRYALTDQGRAVLQVLRERGWRKAG